ncbi:MAG: response regulator [Halieaceae bacterium]|nr:response regulator [Halieaceae bacterium]MCP5164875.1 response regulator [Pseudomonadales bacterium]MCP5205344.1 response regulator [Pseudomonadales bacterium]
MLSRLALIVDDSKTATAVLKHQLNQFDVMVESAADGSLALEMLRDHQPDVIFLDHIMPGLDGFEVLQLLKNNHATRGIPVIMYTSQAARQYTSEAKSLGAIGVIPKKVSDEQLVQVLDKAELYRLKAGNEDRHSPCEAAGGKPASPAPGPTPNDSPGDRGSPVDRNRTTGRYSAAQAAPSRAVDALESDVGAAAPRREAGRGWFTRCLLAALLVTQGYGMVRDSQRQQTIVDLRQQLQRQEQQLYSQEQRLLHAQEQFALEQQQQTEATWRQIQFLVDVLVEQLHGE